VYDFIGKYVNIISGNPNAGDDLRLLNSYSNQFPDNNLGLSNRVVIHEPRQYFGEIIQTSSLIFGLNRLNLQRSLEPVAIEGWLDDQVVLTELDASNKYLFPIKTTCNAISLR